MTIEWTIQLAGAYMDQDDVFYIVKLVDGQFVIEAQRHQPVQPADYSGVQWHRTNNLNSICAGRTACRVTVCHLDTDCWWRVHKQGVWQVYGSPFDLAGGASDLGTPVMTYPVINFNLVDECGQVDIIVRDGALLCIELFEFEDDCRIAGDWKRQFKIVGEELFEPVVCKRLLFQGSISFDTLKRKMVDNRSLPMTMVGPGGRGHATVTVSRLHRHRLLSLLINRDPTCLCVRLVSIAISGD